MCKADNIIIVGFNIHDNGIKGKHFPRYWPFVRGIHRSPVNSPHEGQWRGALMFSFICAWINGWINNRKAGDLRRHRAHYDVILMICPQLWLGFHLACGLMLNGLMSTYPLPLKLPSSKWQLFNFSQDPNRNDIVRFAKCVSHTAHSRPQFSPFAQLQNVCITRCVMYHGCNLTYCTFGRNIVAFFFYFAFIKFDITLRHVEDVMFVAKVRAAWKVYGVLR